MTGPRICIVFNNVDDSTSIGKLSAWAVRTALSAGWTVTVLARDLDPALRPHVEWLPMFVPKRLHLAQWLSAPPVAWQALRGRRFDVVHVSQPQLASMADVLHLHFIVDTAARYGALQYSGRGAKSRLTGLQVGAVQRLEKYALEHLPQRVQVLAVSEFLLHEFRSINKRHRLAQVLEQPVPDVLTVDSSMREVARMRLGLPSSVNRELVVGFLGGDDPRKGGDQLARELGRVPNVRVLLAGSGSDRLATGSAPNVHSFGFQANPSEFLQACDVLASPSIFDPAPLAVVEAAALGVPSVGTASNGSVAALAKAGAAVVVENGVGELRRAIERMASELSSLRQACLSYASLHSTTNQSSTLLAAWESVAAIRSGGNGRLG